ncbi:MAG TPA: Gldg family protein [Alphaproteobacteria bacterium]|nr:Gldg family protein [Alphaproteobacteria bacterium]
MAPTSLFKREASSAGAIVLAVVLFFAVNILSNLTLGSARIDLTADRLFTLSSGTRTLLSRIDEPVTLRFYYSERLGREIPTYGVYAQRVREMLQEYESAAGGKLQLQVIDPQPFSDEEDRAVAFGLQGVPLNQQGELVYFGLAGVNTADKEEIIPFFQPERERFLEYDLTRLIFNLSTTKKKIVGLISTLPLMGEFRGPGRPPEPWAVYTQLAQFFEIRSLERDIGEVPAEIGVLMIVHPRDLSERTQYAIDQFVLRGGHAIVFVDPHAESELGRPGAQARLAQTGSNLKRLFEAWGLEMIDGKFAGDRLLARRVNAGTETRVRAVDYVAWLTLRQDNFAGDDILTSDLGTLNLASAGILRVKEGATTTFTPLVQTTEQSMEIDVGKVRLAPDPVALLAEFKPTGERLTVMARVRGPAKTAFPDGPPPEKKDEEAEKKEQAATNPPEKKEATENPAPQLKESTRPINVIVVADTDLLEDRFWVQVADFFGQRLATPIAANGNLAVNAVDNLAGSDELIGLRSRGQVSRPFLRIQEIQRDAELRFRAKERELTEKLRDTERQLNELQTKSQPQEAAGRVILSKEQQEAIEKFRSEMLTIRKDLRDVQLALRQDIEGLERWLKFINIGLIPVLIALAAIALGVFRARARRRAAARPA